jgi:acyl carrier protein
MEQTFLITFGDTGMSPDSNLFVEGVIDSFGLVELVGFIESTFGVTFSDDDMLSPELNTLNGIVAMVEARR